MFVFMSSFVLAEISISEPLDVYNLGDRLYVDANGLRGSETGNLNINLVCGNTTTNLVKIPAASFSAEEDQSYSFYKILNKEDLEIVNFSEVIGDCQIAILLGTDATSTKTFSISNSVIVSASLNKDTYNPGEDIAISINAVKVNGDLLNGIIYILLLVTIMPVTINSSPIIFCQVTVS